MIFKNDRGFSLIELLTAMTIVSILSAIAVPQYSMYKSRAFNANVTADLKNAVVAQEALYAETEQYVECVNLTCETVLPGFSISQETQITIVTTLDNQEFEVTTTHPYASESYHYDSTVGAITIL